MVQFPIGGLKDFNLVILFCTADIPIEVQKVIFLANQQFARNYRNGVQVSGEGVLMTPNTPAKEIEHASYFLYTL